MKVEIVLDIICSASYVGYTRLTRAAQACRATRNSCSRYCRPDLGPQQRRDQGP